MAKTKKEVKTIKCTCCGEEKKDSDYYTSKLYIYKYTERLSVCKECIWKYVITKNNGYDIDKMKDILEMIDRPFLSGILQTSKDEVNKNTFKAYMKNIGMPQYLFLRWKDGDDSLTKIAANSLRKENDDKKDHESIDIDNKNREDVLRMLGYDPFETENPQDKAYLYNRLVDFLDESTLEDSFKLPAVIEIVKSFNQIDKINLAIARITSNIDRVSSNVGSVKSLIDAKEKMLKSVLALAKDNGISVNHNNNKSKGAGTLSGIIKQLNEKGITAAEVNIYDIETCEGMRQVADISNRSIMEQLMLNESDYTDMIKEQRDMIVKLQEKVDRLEEENRKLKVELKFKDIKEKNV